MSVRGEHFLAVKMFKLLARKADGARFSPYGRIIFSLLSKREKKDRIVCYVCIYNFFFKTIPKKSGVCSRNKKPQTANAWVGIMNVSIVHIKLIAHKWSRTFALQWSLHGVYATARAQRYCVSPSQINMGDQPKRMSCPPRRFVEDSSVSSAKKWWRKWNENAKQTEISMMFWGYWSGYDAKTAKNSFRGIQSRIRWVAWLRW